MANEARAFLDDGDPGAEAAEHLAEFDADVGTADDNEMFGKVIEVEERGVGEEGNGVDAGKVGNNGAAADVEEDFLGAELGGADLDGGGRSERGGAGEDGDLRVVTQRFLDASAGFGDDGFAAGVDRAEVDFDRRGLSSGF